MQEVITILLSLAAVIGLVVFTLYLTKRLMKKFNFRSSSGGGIKIVDCAGIGQDKSIVAVTAGTKKLLLGVTASNITVLAELDDDDISAMTPESDPSDNRSFGDIFAENMKKTFGGNKKGGIK